jgi:chromosome segregation ATPase
VKTEVNVISGSSFDAGVSFAARPDPAVSPKRELPDPIAEMLTNLFLNHLEEGSEDYRLCEQLIGQRYNSTKACRRFIASQSSLVRDRLIAEHERIKTEARAKEKEIANLRAEISDWQHELYKLQDSQSRAMAALRTAVQNRISLSRFSPRSAFEEADHRVEAAEQRVTRENEKVASLQGQVNFKILTDLPRLKKELDAISATEVRLCASLEGKQFTDPELGIVMPPISPL